MSLERPENPFGSRFTRPGALPFLAPSDTEIGLEIGSEIPERELVGQWLGKVLEDLKGCDRCALVGPHGSGKTTLLNLIVRRLEPVFRVTLRIGQRHTELWQKVNQLRIESREAIAGCDDSKELLVTKRVLVIDGYEQLGWMERRRLAWRLRRNRIALLVTAHHPPRGFKVLVTLRGDRATAWRLTHCLLRDFPQLVPVAESQFDEFWSRAQGNVRDLWAILYDWFETELKRAVQAQRIR